MIALICFCLTLFALPFKSKSRLEAENAALRRQVIVLQRRVSGRVQLLVSKGHGSLSARAKRQRRCPCRPWHSGLRWRNRRIVQSKRRTGCFSSEPSRRTKGAFMDTMLAAFLLLMFIG